jgi:alpha-maltose-1-phosphate synthase
VLEASAMGLPILAQPKSSMPEAVIEDVTGWMFSEDNLAIWAEKVQEVQNWTDTQRNSFAEKARAFVTEHYSWDLVAKQYGELYAKAANTE